MATASGRHFYFINASVTIVSNSAIGIGTSLVQPD